MSGSPDSLKIVTIVSTRGRGSSDVRAWALNYGCNGIYLLKLLQKQLSWAMKTCCDRRKFDSSSDLKLQYNVLPVSLYLDWKIVCHLWKIKHTPLPVYVKIKYVNKTIDENKRTKKLHFNQDSAVIISKIVFFFRKPALV